MRRMADESTTPPASFDLDSPDLYLNRELSWLDFNQRVFAEALDARNPLVERVRFLAITANNLDEFLAKRVAWLRQLARTNPGRHTVDGLTIVEQLSQVLTRSAQMRQEIEDAWHGVLEPALAERGTRVVAFESLDHDARSHLHDYFERSVYPVLTPLVVDVAHPFPLISAASVSVILDVRDPRTGEVLFARVKVPPNRPRFIPVGDASFVLLEDLITNHLDMLFPGVEISNRRMMRVLRSIELGEPGEAAEDVLDLISRELERRRLAETVSLELTEGRGYIHEELLLAELRLAPQDIVYCNGPLGLADLGQLVADVAEDELFPPLVQQIPPEFANASAEDPDGMFAMLRQRDVLVHHPYDSFDATVSRFIELAALDPSVLGIKQTTYRTSRDSPVMQSLMEASRRGKQVAACLELTARLDEENNIEWARRLEEAGVHVAYGNPGEKIHGKLCLVVREEGDGIQLYAHIGTGNYNSHTARLYEDFGLFTADPAICADLLRVFNHLTGLADHLETTDLLVGPDNLRAGLESRVQREIEHARAGRPARVIFKMNSLEDRRFTELLYRASQAGVQIDLIVRGVSRIRPGVPGLSEHIRVVSVIGRFLEHSRVYYFENDGSPECYIGSADLMVRNLDERMEALVPVRGPALQARICDILERLLTDRRQGWEQHDVEWVRDQSMSAPGTHERLLQHAPHSRVDTSTLA
jgi:polyphosphate kinase